MGSTSKLSKKCQKCKHKDDCDDKRMVACAFINNPPIETEAAQEASQLNAQPLLQPHDCRDIKINDSMTMTIDLEEVKKELAKRLYPMECYFREAT